MTSPASAARDALGRSYQRTLSPPNRKARGAFYTPAFLVDYLVRHTLRPALAGKTPADLPDVRILDPACGGGAFLLGAFDQLLAWYGPTADPLTILRRHLFGTDTDPDALAVARRSLLQRAGAPAGTSLEMNLRLADALTDPLPTCEVILANPPYLNGVESPTRLPAELRARYRCAAGTVDRSILFQELCLRLLRPGGRCGLVVPNKFLSAPFGQAFRAFAADEAQLELLADFSAARVFDQAAVYPVAYVLRRGRGRDTAPRTTVHVFDRDSARRGEPARADVVSVCPRDVATWDQLFAPDLPLLQRLTRAFHPLADDYEVAASATAAEAYALRDHLLDAPTPPPVGAYRFITSGLIDRYTHHHAHRPARYLKRDFAAPWLPRDCPAINPTRRRQFASEKLLIAGMARGIEALWDDGHLAGAVATVQVLGKAESRLPLKAVLAILNSSFVSRWLRQTYHSLSLAGGYLRIGCPQVAAIPLMPCAFTDRHRRLVDDLAHAAEERLSGQDRDDAIDALVLEWYAV